MTASVQPESITCAVCGNSQVEIRTISGLRRASCSLCQHSQRVDSENFDYGNIAMGATAVAQERLQSQAEFINAQLPANDAIISALEIGCARGDLAKTLKSMHNFGRYHGVELSPGKTTAAKIMNTVFDIPLTTCIEQKLIAESDYDLVIISHCLEHLSNIHEEIGSIKRVLKASGLLFIEVPNSSGHPSLPFDDNRSHLHFFSLSSLCRLLSMHGLEAVGSSSNQRHDARYPDSLRILARPYQAFLPVNDKILSDALGEQTVVVWGAGKMCQEMLEHFFDPTKIEFFVDSDSRKHGSTCMGRPIRDTTVLAEEPGYTVLISSVEHESAIRKQLEEQFKTKVKRVIGLTDLLDKLSRNRTYR
jgi:SAM-dependent methyltransferase